MGGFYHAVIIIIALLFPFVAMPLLWRRMKRVRDDAYHASKAPPPSADWEETVATHDGVNAVRVNQPNAELIALGDKARHSNWPISNQ